MRKRYSKAQWLKKSLDVITRQGFGGIVIDNIVNSMGVTKGSFYWHFKDREDFLEHLVTYWDENFTKSVMSHVDSIKKGANERLLELMVFITKKQLARYDSAIRSLAHNEPGFSRKIQRVFESRIEYVASLFKEMGYKGTDLEMRSRITVMFMSQEQNILQTKNINEQLQLIKKSHAMLTC